MLFNKIEKVHVASLQNYLTVVTTSPTYYPPRYFYSGSASAEYEFFRSGLSAVIYQSSSISDNNVINSVVEYVSEVVLKKVNAVPETDNKSDKDLQAHKHVVVKLIDLRQAKIIVPHIGSSSGNIFSFTTDYSYRYYKEINPPPPKA